MVSVILYHKIHYDNLGWPLIIPDCSNLCKPLNLNKNTVYKLRPIQASESETTNYVYGGSLVQLLKTSDKRLRGQLHVLAVFPFATII